MTTQAEPKRNPSAGRMPVIFAAHGAPILLDDAGWMAELASWAKAMPKPKSILMVSAHWEKRPTTLGATRTVPDAPKGVARLAKEPLSKRVADGEAIERDPSATEAARGVSSMRMTSPFPSPERGRAPEPREAAAWRLRN